MADDSGVTRFLEPGLLGKETDWNDHVRVEQPGAVTNPKSLMLSYMSKYSEGIER